ncbi:hypothetical protein MSMEI_4609 [Mycolicibacterium smegmatis MC2 155]|uniref:Uncharacterized protein n=1 Tax=Mycolicibacterium smegmatis (strain ATCC 700084 / mc(2)155) TaxID=246196 RepID=I7GE01_MYCS2|nr:hypothetical protein MSMEI_4609 [Mycolicibacterium smegmatis MC2 155]
MRKRRDTGRLPGGAHQFDESRGVDSGKLPEATGIQHVDVAVRASEVRGRRRQALTQMGDRVCDHVPRGPRSAKRRGAPLFGIVPGRSTPSTRKPRLLA